MILYDGWYVYIYSYIWTIHRGFTHETNIHILWKIFPKKIFKHQGMKNRINIQWSWQILYENLLHPLDLQNTQNTPLLLFRSCRVNDFAVSPFFLVYLMCLCAFDVLMLCIPFELRIKFNNFSIQYYLQRENPVKKITSKIIITKQNRKKKFWILLIQPEVNQKNIIRKI